MTFDMERIADPTFFQENRAPAHSDHRWFADAAEAASGASSFEQSLNGTWKFHHAENPDAAPAGFEAPGFDHSGWADIEVPGHIQLQGYGVPQYTNVQYPWDGHEAVVPGQVPQRFNPVASYRTTFTLDHPLAAGERLSVSFHGAESAVAVWLNGTYLGYGADSFTPSEFELTGALTAGENTLAAQVFRFTAGSWIEDQDFYRFSGIFRDVMLYRRPAVHAEDVEVRSEVAGDLASAVVSLRVALAGAGTVRASIGGEGALAGDDVLSIRIENPRLWSAEDPYLYDLVVEVLDEAGTVTEVVPLKVGVRRFGIEDGLLKINGRRIVFHGVNRHEFGLAGRVMTRRQTEADIRVMKANNINAVRTSHYPNNSFLYDLCDAYGLYVVDEMNLESHGLWDRIRRDEAGIEEAVPGDRPEWRDVLLDRAANLVERDKNHACVVMWSCGNESFGGTNILAVADWFRARDTRPVHYEGVHWDPRHPQTTDVTSQMYTPAAEIETYLRTHRDKPFVLCEYAHSMGNAFGAVDRYLDLADREPLFQGGFIWDFADQAVPLTDRYGQEYFGYGGDCGEAPHDGDFSANGILFADHTPKPLLAEVAFLYQPFRIRIREASVEVENRLLFTGSAGYDCVVTLAREGEALAEAGLATDVPPGETRTYPLPVEVPDAPGEYTVDVSFRLRAATPWADAGHQVASGQALLRVAGARSGLGSPDEPGELASTTSRRLGATAAAERGAAPELVDGIHNVGVHGPHFGVLFSKLYGGPVSYRYAGRELLQGVPMPNFWHAPTSNERGWGAPFEDGQWLLASRYAKARPDGPVVAMREGAVEVRYTYALPTAPASECDVTYRVCGDGHIGVAVVLRPGAGLGDPPEFGMLFTADADLHRLCWYGEGPHESAVDRRGSSRVGLWSGEVADQLTRYVRPQEAGGHTGVRWAEVRADSGAGLRFDSPDGMEFSALGWTPFEIENALHPHELPPIQRSVLRPVWRRRGVAGDDAWGARTHPEYLLPTGELEFRFGFRGLA